MRHAPSPRALLLAGLAACGPSTGRPPDPPPRPPAPLASAAPPRAPKPAFAYPPTKTVDVADDYHGTKVADPYRWLEDADSAETAAWVKAQNELTFRYLEGIPQRAAIKERLTKLWNYERYGLPYKEGGKYFYRKNDGLANQPVLYVADRLDAPARVLLDPNGLAADGTVAVSGYAVSEDGRRLAYSLAAAGSDWNEIRIRDVATGADLPDVLKWVKFSGLSWTNDHKGFFYSRYDEPKPGQTLKQANYFQKLYYHRVGTPQERDELVYKRDDQKEWSFGGTVSEDGRYLVITCHKGTDDKSQVFYKDLKGGGAKAGEVVELMTGFDAEYTYVGNVGAKFYFKTDGGSPRGRVIAVDLARPDRKDWKVVLAERPEALVGAELVGNSLVAEYLKDARSQVKVHALDGRLVREVQLPGLGSAYGFGGKLKDAETFYSYASYTTPETIYRHDLKTGKSTVFKSPRVDFDPAQYETEQVFYASKDGTKVPMLLTHKKGLAKDGTAPTLLYGYGGFNAAITPSFSVAPIVWMELGGVYAVANLRGGGEYGEEWHQAGVRLKKQNVFDDFIAAAEWLVANHYTSPRRLAIAGSSNGGLLVGAVLNQRPELFGAALPDVGVMDMLRFHKFTIGWAWADDYGTADDPEQFKALYAYSPYHNVKKGAAYPPVLVTTADHDDRVVPGHSFKFAAALQAAQGVDAPVLVRVDVRAGHGAGKPTAKQIDAKADAFAFLVKSLHM
jgi:prolyl oligopeptidase